MNTHILDDFIVKPDTSRLTWLNALIISAMSLLSYFVILALCTYFISFKMAETYAITYKITDINELTKLIKPEVILYSDIISLLFEAIVLIALSLFLIKKDLFKTDKYNSAWVLGNLSDILYGAGYGIIALLIVCVLNMNSLFNLPLQSDEELSRLTDIYNNKGIYFTAISNFILFSISSPTEELLFRGILLGGLSKLMKLPVAILISSVLFALIHFPYDNSLEILLYLSLAFLAIWLRLKSKAIGPAIAMHITYNYGVLIVNLARI